jgi:hypothetical protein
MKPWRHCPRRRASKPWRHTMAPGSAADHSTETQKGLSRLGGRTPRRHRVGRHAMLPWRRRLGRRASKPWRRTMAPGVAADHSTETQKDLAIWGGRTPRRHRVRRRAMIPWRHTVGRHAARLKHWPQYWFILLLSLTS